MPGITVECAKGIPYEWFDEFCDCNDRRERAQPEFEISDSP
ncbi:hypothetical protein F3Y22_tig00111408pilonHSYRG00103 [Hibiscus syriacus]|uniref:Uncharacterized protein n=1 Tax=Hibiscus syriacus TaxID=106335 RepID=A0A6A2YFY8_HIBSY|nr:hypothetical protein F3Y22_tig00111408pilonHSYRG00103 [Hibiscus syriacus]